MNEAGIEIIKTKEVEESEIKYLNINVSNSEVERNPDIVRLCSDAGILEYVKPKKALEQEPLTDEEQRIFLAAMEREEKICREVDEKFPYKVPYEESMVSVCRSIRRKVKKTLWE